ncbi:HAD family hydrolase [Spirillospora sp. CA-253888]
MTRPIAVLDMDGTLLAGTLGVDYLNTLLAIGQVDPEPVTAAIAAVTRYQSGRTTLAAAAPQIYRHYADALRGVPVTAAHEAAHQVWQQARPLLFPFTAGLLDLLTVNGYQTILISGSPHEVVSHAATDLNTDAAQGVVADHDGQHYTGTLTCVPGLPGGKAHAFNELIHRLRPQSGPPHPPDRRTWFAIGNSSSDAEIFTQVGLPLAFEPDPQLAQLATAHQWPTANRHNLLPTLRTLLSAHPGH